VLFGESDLNRSIAAPAFSTYATDDQGLSGIYTVLDRQQMAERWERQFSRLDADVDKLVVWAPESIDSDEWDDLVRWVGSGHTLIISASATHLPGTVGTAGPSGAVSASVHPATVGISNVSVGDGIFTELNGGPLVHLARPDGTPVLVSWSQGNGRIYWSADSGWLTNQRIASDSNLDLALNLLVPARGKVTAFDEYHHGYRAADRWWKLLSPSLQRFVLQLGIALLLLYWAFGTRFGAPRALPPVPPRAAVEYVYSMSQLYRRARARQVVTQSLYRSLTRELSRLLGGLGNMAHPEIARRVAERTGLPEGHLANVLDRLSPQAAPAPTDKELILLSREVEAIQRSVHNAGFRDQHHPGTGAK
jgi:hypothetical protein